MEDTISLGDIERLGLDPSLPYHIWCTDVEKTTELISVARLQNVTILSTSQGLLDSSSGFITNCGELKKIHFILPFVTAIGDSWLFFCRNLKEVSFDLANLENVGSRWLSWSGCDNMDTIKFDGLPRLIDVKDYWMRYCMVSDVDFVGLRNLKGVGDDWLALSPNLTMPQFDGLKDLESVGDRWMYSCKNLTAPNFRGVDSLKHVGEDLMEKCPKIADPSMYRVQL